MRDIRGTTKLAGVVGNPLHHSLSPAMHNAAYEHLGLDWVYVPLLISDEVGLRRLLAAATSLPFVGFNVTMPYKQAVLELCDELATAASMAGAVNTVHCTEGKLVGYNTDGRGLLESLEEETGLLVEGKDVVLLGSGGAAGAALVALVLAQRRPCHHSEPESRHRRAVGRAYRPALSRDRDRDGGGRGCRRCGRRCGAGHQRDTPRHAVGR